MEVNWQQLFDIIVPVLLTIIGFVAKRWLDDRKAEINTAIKDARDQAEADADAIARDFAEFRNSTMTERSEWRQWRNSVGETYLKRVEFDRWSDKMEKSIENLGNNMQVNFDRIADKLDRKADRTN